MHGAWTLDALRLFRVQFRYLAWCFSEDPDRKVIPLEGSCNVTEGRGGEGGGKLKGDMTIKWISHFPWRSIADRWQSAPRIAQTASEGLPFLSNAFDCCQMKRED